jgi:hypothetical protein
MQSPFASRLRLRAHAAVVRLRLASLLRRRSLPGLLGELTPAPDEVDPMPLASVEEALASVEAILERVRVVPDTCLYRALARYAVLRRAGHAARFVMAVKRRAPELTGHAWIELDGEPYCETVDPDLAVTFAYPDPSRAAS